MNELNFWGDLFRTITKYQKMFIKYTIFCKSFYTRGPFFWSGKVFVGVHSHVMDFLQESDFGPPNFSSKFMITCSNLILVHFTTFRIVIGPKLEIQNIEKWTKIRFGHVILNFEEKLSGPKSDFRSKSITWEWTPSNTFLDQNEAPAYELVS